MKPITAKLDGRTYELALRAPAGEMEAGRVIIKMQMAGVPDVIEHAAIIGARLARPDTFYRRDVIGPVLYAVALDYTTEEVKRVAAFLNRTPLMDHYPLAVNLIGGFVFGVTQEAADGASVA